jgi:alpha-beta hydrolase superfamily lysophospholipase
MQLFTSKSGMYYICLKSMKMDKNQTMQGIKQYRFDTKSSPEAMILLVHGLGEHAGRYVEWAKRFTDTEIGIRSFDLPGHGLSDGKRGVMPPFNKIYDIIDDIINQLESEYPGVPLFLYGHSLGGEIALGYLVNRKASLSGAIITSPWIKLTFTPPKAKVIMANLLKGIFPDLTNSSGLNPAHLSHDPGVCEAYVADPLVHDRISLRLFTEAMSVSEEILKNAAEITLPMLLIHGRSDLITSPSGTMEVASAAPQALLKFWDDSYHELHNEPVKDDHFAFIREWIDTII